MNMTSILENKVVVYCIRTVSVSCVALFLLVPQVHAQNALTLSVTPTLFEMAANPGQVWQSNIKVINSNTFDLVVYPRAVNFAPQGETGQGKLIPILEDMTDGATLAEWIVIDESPVTIAPERSLEIPFTVKVPDNAAPGGHFAAILVSTQPPEAERGTLAVRTSQIVSSLFFVRVAGDVIENGVIRSFTTARTFVEEPKATFELRFENKGNVHLQPRGTITIYNMWGKERGVIPINNRTHFGNVLPESVRKFEFTWSGEQSITDIGRYKAVAALGYGQENVQFVTSATYFWVVPLKALAITLGIIFSFFFVVTWAIRMYVRYMLKMAGLNVDRQRPVHGIAPRKVVIEEEHDVRIASYETISAPVRTGYLDLRTRLQNTEAFIGVVRALWSFVLAYRVFFGGVVATSVVFIGMYYFIADITEQDKDFTVSITNPGENVELSAEEIAFSEKTTAKQNVVIGPRDGQTYELRVVNTSGEQGTGATEAVRIIEAGYGVTELTTDQNRIDKRSVIVFDSVLQEDALALSRLLGGALLSARPEGGVSESPNITVFVGKDKIQE